MVTHTSRGRQFPHLKKNKPPWHNTARGCLAYTAPMRHAKSIATIKTSKIDSPGIVPKRPPYSTRHHQQAQQGRHICIYVYERGHGYYAPHTSRSRKYDVVVVNRGSFIHQQRLSVEFYIILIIIIVLDTSLSSWITVIIIVLVFWGGGHLLTRMSWGVVRYWCCMSRCCRLHRGEGANNAAALAAAGAALDPSTAAAAPKPRRASDSRDDAW